jgi:rhodanese-related sulfurtransferase
MNTPQQINTVTLRNWLESGKEVSILDIRPMKEREEWSIPQSIHIDAYDKLKQNDASVFDNLQLDKSIPVVNV